MSATAEGQGWSAQIANALAAIKFGAGQPVTVYVARTTSAAASGTVTLKAVSESDPAKTSSATCRTPD